MATTVSDRRETVSLIGSDKVEGTAVYGADNKKGEDYYPLPWSKLDYDTQLGGYRVDITENQLKGAPKFTRSTDWDWSNRTNDERVYKYYNEPLWY